MNIVWKIIMCLITWKVSRQITIRERIRLEKMKPLPTVEVSSPSGRFKPVTMYSGDTLSMKVDTNQMKDENVFHVRYNEV